MKRGGSLLAGLGLCVLAATAAQAQVGAPSQGQTRGLYVGLGGGWSHVMPFSDSESADKLQFRTKPHEGFVADTELGYDFGRLRLEGELAYRRATVKKTTISSGGSNFPGLTGQSTASGDVAALAWMANAIVDLLPHSRWTPYVGLGVGGVRLQLENYAALGTTFVHQSDMQLAYQGMAGVRYQMTPRVSMTLDYRYFAATKADIRDIKGATFRVPYASHNVMLGIAYHFSAPPPPPPPAPAPLPAPIAAPAPPPPPPAPPALPPHNFIVYFNFDKYDLTPDARKTVEDAAASYKQSGSARIAIDGYTDLAGTALYNLKLSKRRADTVHAYLVKLGVPDGAVQQNWHGKENPAVPTPDGTREPRNRRVEIVF